MCADPGVSDSCFGWRYVTQRASLATSLLVDAKVSVRKIALISKSLCALAEVAFKSQQAESVVFRMLIRSMTSSETYGDFASRRWFLGECVTLPIILIITYYYSYKNNWQRDISGTQFQHSDVFKVQIITCCGTF